MTGPRVGVSLLWLAPAEVGGSEDYSIGLLRAVARRVEADRPLDLVVYVNREVARVYPDLAEAFTVRVAPISGRRRLARVVAEHTWLAAAARRDRLDLVHFLGGTMPFVRVTPGMVALHDLQPWAYPQHFTPIKRAYLHLTVPRSARAARVVTTLSDWVRHDIHRRLRVPLDRIVCLPPGAERLVRTGAASDEDEVLDRYELAGHRFFLYPVITYPHKNHRTLVAAFARVAAHHPDALLVLPGGVGPAEQSVAQAVRDAGVARSVRRLGRIPHGDLEVLYRTTTALTFPSRYEGFGMSLLEVMHHGRPVIASDVSAIPEVVGDGGVLLDPDDVEAWASAMSSLLDDAERWRALADAARARAARFSWDRTVDVLFDLYGRAARGVGAAPR